MSIRKQGVSVSLSIGQIASLDEITRRAKISRSKRISEGVDIIIHNFAKQLNLLLVSGVERLPVESQKP
jgi:hypothetical protein